MTAFLVAGAVVCALLAVRTQRLLPAAIYLAAVSMFTALILYDLGSAEAAVVELSVGAGLVTVLFVFAIAITGEDELTARPIVPAPAAWLLVSLAAVAVGVSVFPLPETAAPIGSNVFRDLFWEARGLDALVQVGLIFAGVMGILGLLVDRGRRTL